MTRQSAKEITLGILHRPPPHMRMWIVEESIRASHGGNVAARYNGFGTREEAVEYAKELASLRRSRVRFYQQ